MKIESKFDLYDEVFYIQDNKIKWDIVYNIALRVYPKCQSMMSVNQRIIYTLKNNLQFDEEHLFKDEIEALDYIKTTFEIEYNQ